jgi:hypothetical protein
MKCIAAQLKSALELVGLAGLSHADVTNVSVSQYSISILLSPMDLLRVCRRFAIARSTFNVTPYEQSIHVSCTYRSAVWTAIITRDKVEQFYIDLGRPIPAITHKQHLPHLTAVDR